MANGQDKTEKHPHKDMINKDNNEIEKLSINERLECKKIQAETQERQAQARKHERSIFHELPFYGIAIPFILTLIISILTGYFSGWFDVKQKRLENQKILLKKEKVLLEIKNAKLDKEYEEKLLSLENEKAKLINENIDLRESLRFEEKGPQVKTEDVLSFNHWYHKGAGEFLVGKYDKAIDSFKKALPKAQNEASASYTHNYIGSAYSNSGRNEEALEELKNSIDSKRDNPLPYINRASIYLGLDRYDEAKKNLNIADELIKGEKVDEKTKPFLKLKIQILRKKLNEALSKGSVFKGTLKGTFQ